MYYNINFDIASIVILLILVLCKYKYFFSENSVTKQFMNVVTMVIITCVLNILAALCYSRIIPGNDKVMLLIETIYLIAAIASCYLQLMVIAQRFSTSDYFIKLANFILVAAYSICLGINIYGHFIFEYIDHEFCSYAPFTVVYMIYAIFFIEMFVLIVVNKDKFRRQTVILTSVIMVLPIVSLIIQFFDDSLLLTELGATIAFFIYSFSLEDQDYDKWQSTLIELEELKKEELANKEKIEAINKVKTLFMGNVSEELRAPIEDIIAVSNGLKERNESKELNEYAGRISDSGIQLMTFVDKLIEASGEEDRNEKV